MRILKLVTLNGLFLALLHIGCAGSSSSNEDTSDSEAFADTDPDSDKVTDADTEADTDAWSGPESGRCEFGRDATQLMFSDVTGGSAEETEISAGIEVCPDESAHRYEAVSCASEYVPTVCNTCNGGEGCAEGEICHDHWDMCFCYRPCMEDADCAADEVCLCGMSSTSTGFGPYGFSNYIPQCLPAGCRSDADCGEYRCGVSLDGCGGFDGLYCHTAEDPCESAAQCLQEELENEDFFYGCNYSTEDESFDCISYNYCE